MTSALFGHFVVKVLHLSMFGGHDVKQTVGGVMGKLLRRSVCLLYSYMGRKGKLSFCDLRTCKAVFGINRFISLHLSQYSTVVLTVVRVMIAKYRK